MEDTMLRQVMIPSKENSTINIPSEYYGIEVEVFVFPFYDAKANKNSDNTNDIFSEYLYSFNNFKFDRNDANNYE